MNRAEQRKYHVIYKTTCIVTGKYYLGMHSTDNLDDGYLGSGSILSRSVKKYGKENHSYKVLEFLPNRKLLALREEEIITPEIRADKMCMNIRSGGTGNQPGKALKEETKAKMSASIKKMWKELKESGYQKPKQSVETIAKRVAKNTGKKRTEKTKQKMRDASVLYYASRTKEHQKLQSEKMSVSKSKSWKIESESGDILIVTNLKKFSEEHGIIGTVFYTTQISGKYINGFRAVGKI